MGFNPFLRMINSLIWEGTFHNEFLNKEKAIEIYNKHVEEVKKVVPADRLLVFSVQEGWAPLCRFLDVPVHILFFFKILFIDLLIIIYCISIYF